MGPQPQAQGQRWGQSSQVSAQMPKVETRQRGELAHWSRVGARGGRGATVLRPREGPGTQPLGVSRGAEGVGAAERGNRADVCVERRRAAPPASALGSR